MLRHSRFALRRAHSRSVAVRSAASIYTTASSGSALCTTTHQESLGQQPPFWSSTGSQNRSCSLGDWTNDQKRVRFLSTSARYDPITATAHQQQPPAEHLQPQARPSEIFPSLLIRADGTVSADPDAEVDSVNGSSSFAEAQAMYLEPDPVAVDELRQALVDTNAGIVAHYYMDVELQGVLQAVQQELPGRIGIADSLKMGDLAVDMMQQDGGADAIVCLGVDFMSESVQAVLHQQQQPTDGTPPVYRAATAKIGCSLAESAERDVYRAWLQTESTSSSQPALHVVYINTSLETKAVSNSIVPTITCTSSNVLSTLLQSSAQIPDLKILFGPDTYMGENLVTLLTLLLEQEKDWDDAKIARDLHPQHDRASLTRLRDSINVFPAGNCIVHHMFGESVVDTVTSSPLYEDCYVTAHLEVPGEMFQVAMKKSLEDRGVVGSTSDILHFIRDKVQDATTAPTKTSITNGHVPSPQRLRFVLGTEAGMVTSIVRSVQDILLAAKQNHQTPVEVEIIFPVSSDAVTATTDQEQQQVFVQQEIANNGAISSSLPLVPGVRAGEGCSTAGGCATCPYMKMNNLDSLMDLLELIGKEQKNQVNGSKGLLKGHLPPDRLRGKHYEGVSAMDLGTQPIQYMRDFMKDKALPDALVQRILRPS